MKDITVGLHFEVMARYMLKCQVRVLHACLFIFLFLWDQFVVRRKSYGLPPQGRTITPHVVGQAKALRMESQNARISFWLYRSPRPVGRRSDENGVYCLPDGGRGEL